jgi:hypothetical protein
MYESNPSPRNGGLVHPAYGGLRISMCGCVGFRQNAYMRIDVLHIYTSRVLEDAGSKQQIGTTPAPNNRLALLYNRRLPIVTPPSPTPSLIAQRMRR